MVNVEAVAWAREILGEPGPHVLETLPGLLAATHSKYVATQNNLGLTDASPYGLMWLGVPKALVDAYKGIVGVQLYRPKYGRYHLPIVNGVPIIPWRYAKDGKTDPKGVPFGRPVSQTRQALFQPPDLQPELPLGEEGLGDAVLDELTPEQRQQVDQYSTDIRTLATEGLVAVLAYASNPDALLNAHFGYATLGPDDLLVWIHIDELKLSYLNDGMLRGLSSPTARPTFDSGPLEEPKLRPRQPLEDPTNSDPPSGPTGTNE
jgi:hypothetical protein